MVPAEVPKPPSASTSLSQGIVWLALPPSPPSSASSCSVKQFHVSTSGSYSPTHRFLQLEAQTNLQLNHFCIVAVASVVVASRTLTSLPPPSIRRADVTPCESCCGLLKATTRCSATFLQQISLLPFLLFRMGANPLFHLPGPKRNFRFLH